MPQLPRTLMRLAVAMAGAALALTLYDGVWSSPIGHAAFYVMLLAIALGLAGALLSYLQMLLGAETVAGAGWRQGTDWGYTIVQRRLPWWVMLGGLLLLGMLIRPPAIKSLTDQRAGYSGVVVRRGFEWPMLPPYTQQWFVVIRGADGREVKRYTNFYAENRVRPGDSVVKRPGLLERLEVIPRTEPLVR
jgi:hypothetical protein